MYIQQYAHGQWRKLVKAVFSEQGDTRHGATSYDPDNNRCPGVLASVLSGVFSEVLLKHMQSLVPWTKLKLLKDMQGFIYGRLPYEYEYKQNEMNGKQHYRVAFNFCDNEHEHVSC